MVRLQESIQVFFSEIYHTIYTNKVKRNWTELWRQLVLTEIWS